MTEALAKYNADAVRDRIFTVRGQKIILDSDLAAIYGVATKVLNQAVKRNADKFPDDFMFRLTKAEAEDMRCSRSQSVTLKRGQNIKYLPHARPPPPPETRLVHAHRKFSVFTWEPLL